MKLAKGKGSKIDSESVSDRHTENLRNFNKKLIKPKMVSPTREELWLYIKRSIITMNISNQKEPEEKKKRGR